MGNHLGPNRSEEAALSLVLTTSSAKAMGREGNLEDALKGFIESPTITRSKTLTMGDTQTCQSNVNRILIR